MQARFLRFLEAAVVAANSVATEITQIFRPERYSRSDTGTFIRFRKRFETDGST